ncbi:hypothetical protein DFJ74DRAFT_50660 [Hyaloraphidium curvatum]|nr:hypothetical protein DFJ74DRAFT_50660 [Hyaloraphidium curvatum]
MVSIKYRGALFHAPLLSCVTLTASTMPMVARRAPAARRSEIASVIVVPATSARSPLPMNWDASSLRVCMKGRSATSSTLRVSAGCGLGVASTTSPIATKAAPSMVKSVFMASPVSSRLANGAVGSRTLSS